MVAMMVENINRELRRTRETHRPKLDTAQRASARPLPECRRYQLVTPSNTKFFMIRGFLRERSGFAGASAFALKQGVLGGWLTLKSNTERRNAPSPRPSPLRRGRGRIFVRRNALARHAGCRWPVQPLGLGVFWV